MPRRTFAAHSEKPGSPPVHADRAFVGGALASVPAPDDLGVGNSDVLNRSKSTPAQIEDVILGCARTAGEDDRDVRGRTSSSPGAVGARWPGGGSCGGGPRP